MTTKWSSEMHRKCKNNDCYIPAVPAGIFLLVTLLTAYVSCSVENTFSQNNGNVLRTEHCNAFA